MSGRTSALRSMPLVMQVFFGLFLVMPFWSLTFLAAPWQLDGAVLAHAWPSAMAYWVLPPILAVLIVRRSFLFIPLFFLECLGLVLHATLSGNASGNWLVVRYLLVGVMLASTLLFFNKDLYFPLLSTKLRFWRRSARMPAQALIKLQSGSDKTGVMVEDCSATGMAVAGDLDEVAKVLGEKGKGDEIDAVITHAGKTTMIHGLVAWIHDSGPMRRVGFEAIDSEDMKELLKLVSGVAELRPGVSKLQALWVQSSFRRAMVALSLASTVGSALTPACGSMVGPGEQIPADGGLAAKAGRGRQAHRTLMRPKRLLPITVFRRNLKGSQLTQSSSAPRPGADGRFVRMPGTMNATQGAVGTGPQGQRIWETRQYDQRGNLVDRRYWSEPANGGPMSQVDVRNGVAPFTYYPKVDPLNPNSDFAAPGTSQAVTMVRAEYERMQALNGPAAWADRQKELEAAYGAETVRKAVSASQSDQREATEHVLRSRVEDWVNDPRMSPETRERMLADQQFIATAHGLPADYIKRAEAEFTQAKNVAESENQFRATRYDELRQQLYSGGRVDEMWHKDLAASYPEMNGLRDKAEREYLENFVLKDGRMGPGGSPGRDDPRTQQLQAARDAARDRFDAVLQAGNDRDAAMSEAMGVFRERTSAIPEGPIARNNPPNGTVYMGADGKPEQIYNAGTGNWEKPGSGYQYNGPPLSGSGYTWYSESEGRWMSNKEEPGGSFDGIPHVVNKVDSNGNNFLISYNQDGTQRVDGITGSDGTPYTFDTQTNEWVKPTVAQGGNAIIYDQAIKPGQEIPTVYNYGGNFNAIMGQLQEPPPVQAMDPFYVPDTSSNQFFDTGVSGMSEGPVGTADPGSGFNADDYCSTWPEDC